MLRRLLDDLRAWTALWRRRHALRSQLSSNEGSGYLLMFSLPFIVLAVIVFLAMTMTDPRVEPERRNLEAKRQYELRCLAENIYYEARGEPLKGQAAVAEVTLNRLHSKQFKDTLCKVVYESRWDRIRKRMVAHFSWTGGERPTSPTGPAWDQAMAVATAVYDHTQQPVVPGALYYHATYVHPSWAKGKKPLATIGNHIFYE